MLSDINMHSLKYFKQLQNQNKPKQNVIMKFSHFFKVFSLSTNTILKKRQHKTGDNILPEVSTLSDLVAISLMKVEIQFHRFVA